MLAPHVNGEWAEGPMYRRSGLEAFGLLQLVQELLGIWSIVRGHLWFRRSEHLCAARPCSLLLLSCYVHVNLNSGYVMVHRVWLFQLKFLKTPHLLSPTNFSARVEVDCKFINVNARL